MSRTTLCILTAAGLTLLSGGLIMGRRYVLGAEVKAPSGPKTWKVSLLVTGKSTSKNAKLRTITPLDFDRQHIRSESFQSAELIDKPPDSRQPNRRQVLWSQRPNVAPGPFRAHYQFFCEMEVNRPSSPMSRLAKNLNAPPNPGEFLKSEPLLDSLHEDISALAKNLTAGQEEPTDQAEAFFHYVDREIAKEPSVGGTAMGALACKQNGRGDEGAKSRLLVSLCRNRGIPARLVTGLRLVPGPDQRAHIWAEAWVRDHWLPMCPFYHHFGRIPASYLILGFGDLQIVRGRHAQDLNYAFLVERTVPENQAAAVDPWPLRRVWKQLSLGALPPPEQRLVEFLLLVPIAALIVCLYRNVIGLQSFGTFAPALVGLAFRELHSLPGILVFASLVLIGWGMRRVLDHYHLLQVPRTALMLSLIVVLMVAGILAANFKDLPATKYIPLFPIVILTGMIERFWTLETEDNTLSSFKTMLGTLFIALTIALVLSIPAVVEHMFRYPETLGLIMAGQLLIGRYTGYRLAELFRFRELAMHEG